jgi:hypothetical protein
LGNIQSWLNDILDAQMVIEEYLMKENDYAKANNVVKPRASCKL